ncbi:MAG: signal peptidase I [Candidatus Staskawiczbacteria bacterium RIFOXYD1_FULL_39_28]|uniref:Signal peptidase I n=1 Tax=Candidatus Staskawiczbacteria bacterium RIFOXYC1_FULL_38_18 TaxID=1802229 RepID=A0A1G2JAC0_9BACT|nr:MAG: signal peptidase I [Candidatus Staskawiczbacteria bacterium RIFOXYC1_FULL_38_18]OGZ91435.1 MAG: signal peptidase I [Candidatus Staskawiczbacteria bacterium RIFOXYD1_FULL_39_28]
MENNQTNNIVEEKDPEKEIVGYKKYLSFAWELFKIALIALVIVLPIRYFLFQPFIVKGESMAPNFESGDYLIVDEISYRLSNPQRGDVVVFDFPKDTSQRFIKRVIGLPGETVNVVGGKVEIIKDGKITILEEKYLPDNLKTIGEIKITLKEKEYFVLGDNRDYSYDSRAWGVVPQKDLVGKAFLRLFPVTELFVIPRPSY